MTDGRHSPADSTEGGIRSARRPVFEKDLLSRSELRFVLLDMDGTLLDLYFDDYFWGRLLPEKYAAKHGQTVARATDELTARYRHQRGTLNWADVDFWSGELDLDIPALKEQIKHLVAVHPYVEVFLKKLKSYGKKVFLVTDAHYKVLDLKMQQTRLGRYFEACITSFELGHPKEDLRFWQKLQEKLAFDKENTLFIDDTERVLKTARQFGIKYVVYKTKANSQKEPSVSKEFPTISDFRELPG